MFLGLLADFGDGARSLPLLLTFLLLLPCRTAERRPGEGVLSFSLFAAAGGADHFLSGVALGFEFPALVVVVIEGMFW